MTDQKKPARELPGVFRMVISVGIVFHLLALGAVALAVQNGPWSVRYLSTPSNSDGPMFASSISQYTTPYYLQPLMLANNYHFSSNLTDLQTIYLELAGQPKNKAVKYPDAKANMWVRYRQRLLVSGIGDDKPIQAPAAEPVYPPGEAIPEVTFFCSPFDAVQLKLGQIKDIEFKSRESFVLELERLLTEGERERYQDEILKVGKGHTSEFQLTDRAIKSISNPEPQAKSLHMYQLPITRLPKGQLFYTPSPAASILVRSYARYLERQKGEPVELVRLFRNPMGPAVMFPSPLDPSKLTIDAPPYDLDTIANNLGNGKPRSWSPK